jgi:hypothetical protein
MSFDFNSLVLSFNCYFQLALSAASPIWRGYLAEIDCRWNVLCAMSDDRTAEERGFEVNRISMFDIEKILNKSIATSILFSDQTCLYDV